MVRGLDPAALLNADGEIEVDGGTTRVALVRWEANDPAAPGSPASFFGVVASDRRDSSGNIIYVWVADRSACST